MSSLFILLFTLPYINLMYSGNKTPNVSNLTVQGSREFLRALADRIQAMRAESEQELGTFRTKLEVSGRDEILWLVFRILGKEDRRGVCE